MANLIANLIVLYLALGFAFGLWFSFVGSKRIDDVAKQTTRGFRFMVIWGAMALWPVLLLPSIKGKSR